jgi:ribosome-binding factor A
MAGYHLARVTAEIQNKLAHLLQTEVQDPRIAFVTVTAVKVSKDLSVAKIYVLAREDEDRQEILKRLNHAAGFLRTRLAKTTTLRKTPELRFFYDDIVEAGLRITDVLENTH